MGKIIKNDVIYAGVPDEVITAWETEEVQDLPEIAYGDADISEIGDGSITGAIAEHEEAIGNTNISSIGDGSITGAISSLNSNFNNVKIKYFSKNITIPDGTTSSPSDTSIDLTNDLPANASIVGINVFLGAYLLPYSANSGAVQTWIRRVDNLRTVRIINTTTGWSTQIAYFLVFYH